MESKSLGRNQKIGIAAALVPLVIVVAFILLGRAEVKDLHQHLEDYSKWILGFLLLGAATIKGAEKVGGPRG